MSLISSRFSGTFSTATKIEIAISRDVDDISLEVISLLRLSEIQLVVKCLRTRPH